MPKDPYLIINITDTDGTLIERFTLEANNTEGAISFAQAIRTLLTNRFNEVDDE